VSDNKTQEPADLRQAYDALVVQHKATQAEFTTFKAQTIFKEAKLSPKHAELYLAANPDAEVSAEAVAAFAEEYSLRPAEVPAPVPVPDPAQNHLPADGSPPPVERTLGSGPAPADAALASVAAAAGSPQGTLGAATPVVMSAKEFETLLKTNPDAAAQAYAEGRVARNEGNVQADHLQSKGVIR
jgi:hypothetical protein